MSFERSVCAAMGIGKGSSTLPISLQVKGRHAYVFFSCPVKDIVVRVALSVVEILKQLSEVVVVWLLKEV